MRKNLILHVLILMLVICGFSNLQSQSDEISHYSDTRMLAGYTANMLDKGNVQIQSIDLILHTIEFGITDFITFGGGASYFPDWNQQMMFFKLKLGGNISESVSLALANYWLVPLPGAEDYDFISPVYGLASINLGGSIITGGIGTLLTEDEAQIIAQLGGIFPLGSRFSLVSENWWGYDPTDNFYNESAFVVGLGGRYKNNHWTFELGSVGAFVIGDDGNGGGALPHLSVSFGF